MEDIVEGLLCALHEGSGGQLLSDFEKYDALSALAALLEKRLGYTGDPTSETSLSEHLLLSAAFCTLPEDVMSGYSIRSPGHMRASASILSAIGLTGRIPAAFSTRYAAGSNRRRTFPTCFLVRKSLDFRILTFFPCVNEVILTSLLGSLAQGVRPQCRGSCHPPEAQEPQMVQARCVLL